MLLLDKAQFPREKICGEFISPEIPEVLDRLEVLQPVQEKKPWEIQGILISSYQTVQFKLNFPQVSSRGVPRADANFQGFNMPRFILDEILLRNAGRAGAEVLEGFKVVDLIFQDDRILGVKGVHPEGYRVEFKSRLVVGAGGRNCVVAKRLNLHAGYRWLRKMGLMTYFKGVQDPGRYVEMYVNPPGYCGIAPLGEDLVNVSLVVDLDAIQGYREKRGATVKPQVSSSGPKEGDLSDYFLESLFKNRLVKEKLEGARMVRRLQGVGPLAFRARRCSWDGALLVGDSAGFIDPFTGEGIYHALRSGELAAEVIHEAFKANNFSKEFLQRYDRARTQEFRRKFRICHALQHILYRPWLANRVARSLARDSVLKDWLVPWNP